MPSVLKYGLGLFTKKKTQSSKFHEFQAYDHLRHPAYPISNVANGANLAGHPHLQAALPPHSFSHRQQFYPQQILPPPQIACQCQQCSYQTATLNQQPSQVQLIPNPQPHLQPPQQQHPPPAPHIQLQPLQAQPQQLQSQQQQIQQCHQQQQQQQQPYHSYANPQNIISQPVPPPQPVASCTCQHCPLVQQQQQQQHPHFQQHQQQQQLQIHQQQQQLQLHHHHHQHQQQQHFPNGQQMQLNHNQVNGTCQYQNQQVLVNQHQQPVQQQQPLQHQQQQFIPQNHISQHQIGLSHQPQMAPIVLQPQPQPQPTPAPIHQQQQLQQHQQQQQQQFPSIQAQPPTFQCHTIQPQQFQHQKHQYQQQQHQRIQSLFPQTQMTPSQSRSQPQLALQSLHHTPQEESQSESQSRYANVSQCVINDSLHSQSHSNPKYKDHVYCNEKSYSLEVTLPPYQDPPDYDTFMIMKRKKVLYPGYSNGQHLAYHSESLDLRREKDSSYENLRSGGYDNIGINRQELGCNGTS